MPKPLKIRAEDEADLEVVSACLQDAVVSAGEVSFDPDRRRFAMAIDRFMWEQTSVKQVTGNPAKKWPRSQSRLHRVEGGLHFESVLSVKTQNFPRSEGLNHFELLTIHCDPEEQGAATITLVFAGGSAIRLEVECIDCYVIDTGQPIGAQRRPRHPVPRGAGGP